MSQAFLDRVSQRCSRCQAPIVWARTDGGKAMPVDLLEDLAGNVGIFVDGAGTVRARVITSERPVEPHERLHVPHFATCGVSKVATPRQDNVIPIYRARARRGLT